MYSKLQLFCICLLFTFTSSMGCAAEKKESSSELQVLIDVSGSMKHNDPKNLRIPALKLLVNLLPDGTKAGIWLFAEKTKVLVETGIVDKKWKKQALSRLKKIHSSGLFTHIEDAIQQSSENWFKKPADQPRNLILLTDGVVDVSKDIMESAESRERILVEQISQLQQSGVRVYTIALSNNADTPLLEKLAFDTNGWSETVQHADQLQKVFFKMFKQAVPKDTVPIEGNAFTVDSSINEFSVLVFKKAGAQETRLISPDKSNIANNKKPDNVSWLTDSNYDLITIKKPIAGEWKIVAEVEPDNQVMIVTDLKIKVSEIPNHISNQDSIDLTAYFSDKHQLISRDDFLSLIELSIELTSESGAKQAWQMQPDPEKVGLFRKRIGPGIGKGRHTLKLQADGKTFQREFTQTIEVIESLVKVNINVSQKTQAATIQLIPDKNVINIDMMSIQANITQPGLAVKTQELLNKNGVWELIVEKANVGDKKIVNFSITANSINGHSLSPNVKPVVIDENLFSQPEMEPQIDKQEETSSETESVISNELVEEDVGDEESFEENDDVNWIKTSAIVLAVNIILIAAGFFLVKFFKKRAATTQAQLLARLE